MGVLTTPPLPPWMIQDIWKRAHWKPTELQRAVLLSRARNTVTSAGRRAGKSQSGGYKLVPEAFRAAAEKNLLEQLGVRREYWIVGPEYSDAEKEFRVVWNALKRLDFPFDQPGSYNNPLSGEMHISLFGGKFIISAKSAKYPNTLVGEALSGVVFSEAAKLKLSVFHKFIRPTLADFEGWAFFGSTPEGRNWFYDFWETGQDPARVDWASWRAPSWSNHNVFRKGVDEEVLGRVIEARRKGTWKNNDALMREAVRTIDREIWAMFQDMSMEMFNQEVAALFTEYVGRVFKDFDEEVHVGDFEYEPSWETYACVDYGFTNPFAWLLIQVDPHHEKVRVLREYYETGKTTEEAAMEIRSLGYAPSSIRAFYPDPAEPDRTKELANRLHLRSASPGSLSVSDRIEWIRRKLKPILGHVPLDHIDNAPGLQIHRSCHNTIREMGAYRYKETAEKASERGAHAPEEPMKKDDHTPEALGRFFSGFFGSPWKASRARQSKIRIGR